MWIERRSRRSSACRYCRQPIVWVTRVSTGRTLALDPPLVFAPSLLDSESDLLDVDRRQTALHAETCTAFDPRLTAGERAHV